MKKSLISTLIAVMLFSFCFSANFGITAHAETETETVEHKNKVDFSERIDFSDISNGNGAGHGNHQTRNVHTSHGDYVTFITSTTSNSKGEKFDEFKVIRVNEDRSYEVVLTEYKIYDTSQVGLFVDNDENVWAVTIGDNKYRQNPETDAILANAWMIDKETDDVTNYSTIALRKTTGGYGYSYFCFDEVMNKLYTVTASGDEPGEIAWLIFDLETKTWDNKLRVIETEYRNCYPYIYADGKGGMMILNQPDYKATTAGYPEVSDNYGLTQDDIQSIEGSYQSSSTGEWKRPKADYVFDQLELYYIPDVYKEEAKMMVVAERDYTRVTGTQEQRYTLEYRAKNEYPNVQNNNGGDTFLDADGYLHVIYCVEFYLAAYNNNMRTDRYWYHDVIDVSNPDKMVKLSHSLINDDGKPESKNSYSFRMYQTTDGNLYLISTCCEGYYGDVIVYYVNGDVNNGYKYDEIGRTSHVGDRTICISNNRGNSLEDNVITYVWRNGDHNMYRFNKITIGCAHNNATWEHDDDKHWQNCGECNETVNEGEHEFEWVIDKEATYEESGIKHEECKCGLKRNENTEIAKLVCTHEKLGDWKHDDDKHWQECLGCEQKFNEGEHEFKWVTDKEATYKEAGVKHEECKCGLKRNENTAIDKLADPEVGDNDMTFWILFATSLTMLVSVTLVLNKKRKFVK